jgi:putative ABC transport system substrate-binding protein
MTPKCGEPRCAVTLRSEARSAEPRRATAPSSFEGRLRRPPQDDGADRRAFLALIAGAAVAWPLGARAQQPATPTVGFLTSQPVAASEAHVVAFRKGLAETGHVEGQNVRVEHRAADGRNDALRAHAAELVGYKAAVIAASGTLAARAAKSASESLPIVFTTGSDPVKLGLVLSLNRPRRNATGVVLLTTALEAKRLELVRDVRSRPRVIAFLVNPNDPDGEAQLAEAQAAARAIGQKMVTVEARNDGDIDAALKRAVAQNAGALIVANDLFFDARRARIVETIAQHRIPAIYPSREYVAAGGLMSYAASLAEAHRLIGAFAGRILKGEKPGAIRVARASAFELAVNRRTANALGLTLPPSILLRADEVIE